jgi:hypothetical protein
MHLADEHVESTCCCGATPIDASNQHGCVKATRECCVFVCAQVSVEQAQQFIKEMMPGPDPQQHAWWVVWSTAVLGVLARVGAASH